MPSTIYYARTFLSLLSLCVFTSFSYTASSNESLPQALVFGAIGSALFMGLLFGIEKLALKWNLKAFNLTILGMFLGLLMGNALIMILGTLVNESALSLSSQALGLTKAALLLFSLYFGVVLTLKASQELAFSIPFIQFKRIQEKKKDILLDANTLIDQRLIDLANSGLLDHQLVIPHYAIKDLQTQSDSGDDQLRFKAKKAIENYKKLEAMPTLALRTTERDFPDLQEQHLKLMKIAREIDANILTADISKIQQSEMEGLKVININFLSQALKPTTTAGEHLQIKVLRYGKEPRQGVGYLEDGTMVVINGGAEFMGQTIKALVLSVKSTPAGRMIFCNTTEPSDPSVSHDFLHERDLETTHP